MDLNFYLGLPRSTCLQSLDLGSDITPSSLSLSTSFATEDIHSSLEMSSSSELTPSHAPYSPSHASIDPGPSIPLTDANSNQEDTPSFPSYEQYRTLYSPIRLGPNGTHYHTPAAVGMPTPQGLGCYEPYDPPYDPLSPSYITVDPPGMGFGEQLPVPRLHPWRSFSCSMYSAVPSYVHTLPSPPPLHAHSRFADLFDNVDDLSPRSDLIESRSRMRLRWSERRDYAQSIPPSADQIMLDLVSPERSSDTNGKFRPKGVLKESSKEAKEEKNKAAANFECNICMDMAQEPVVTSCGHLYCWPCLYQWLYVHSGHRECPVCKGEVTEANITPIYGRGDSEYSERKKVAHKDEPDTKIPSRPHGNRLESSRQQLNPISLRLGEGLASSGGVIHQEMLYNEHHLHPNPVLTSPRRLLTEELNVEIGGDAEETRLPRDRDFTRISHSSDTNPIFYDRNADFGHRLAATTADVERILHNSNRYEASTSYANHRSHEQLIPRTDVESISAVSSTAAGIQGGVGFTDSSALLNGVGSFGSYRRRGRSSISGSFDADDGFLRAHRDRSSCNANVQLVEFC